MGMLIKLGCTNTFWTVGVIILTGMGLGQVITGHYEMGLYDMASLFLWVMAWKYAKKLAEREGIKWGS